MGTTDKTQRNPLTMTKHYRERFSTFREFVGAVVGADQNNIDPRLLPLATSSGANSTTPSDGGFLIQEDFAEYLTDRIATEGELIGRCAQIPMSGNSLTLPAIDETSRQDGDRLGGVRLHWADEAGTVTATKPRFRGMRLNAKKLTGFIFATSELAEDVPALSAWLEKALVSEAIHTIEQEIITGGGTRTPLGIMNSGALITVNGESGQAAASIRPDNFSKMLGRFHPEGHGRGLWLVSLEGFQQITGQSLYDCAPLVQYQNGRTYVLGQELLISEYTSELGSSGDLLLIDPAKYIVSIRSREFVSSIHLGWLAAENCFRFSLRLDGQPAVAVPVVPKNCTETASPFVSLAAR
jgi:HK97 family phage major capsid protein